MLPTTLPEAEKSIERKREPSFTLDLKTSIVRMEHSISIVGGGDSGYTSSTARVFFAKEAAASEKQSSELTERIVALEEETGVIEVMLGNGVSFAHYGLMTHSTSKILYIVYI